MLHQLPRAETNRTRPLERFVPTVASTPQQRPGWRERWRMLVAENPVYGTELRQMIDSASLSETNRARIRRAREKRPAHTSLSRLQRSAFTLGIAFVGAYMLLHFLEKYGQVLPGLSVSLLCGPLIAAALPAKAITRERERGTWEALLLSSLTAEQILGGKFLAHLRTQLGNLTPLVVFALAALAHGWIPLALFLLSLTTVATGVTLSTVLALDASLRRSSSARAVSLAMWRTGGVLAATLAAISAGVLALMGVAPTTLLSLPALFLTTSAWVGGQIWRGMLLDLRQDP